MPTIADTYAKKSRQIVRMTNETCVLLLSILFITIDPYPPSPIINSF